MGQRHEVLGWELLVVDGRVSDGTLPETNMTSHLKTPMFPCKHHQNGGFSMAMLVYRRVNCWNASFLLGPGLFSGAMLVSGSVFTYMIPIVYEDFSDGVGGVQGLSS